MFSNTSGTIHGTYDENDFGKVLVGNTLTATDNGVGADVYGRGGITGFTDPNNGNAPISLVYYLVGPEVLRIIDIDFNDALVGSAYGQGSATSFDSTVLSKDVFGILDNTSDELVVAAGQLVAVNTAVGTFSAIFTGEGDDDEGGAVTVSGTPGGVAGNYSFLEHPARLWQHDRHHGVGTHSHTRAVCDGSNAQPSGSQQHHREPTWEPRLSLG